MPLLAVANRRQQQRADCLAACASMLLEHLGVSISYPNLLRLLRIEDYGAPFSNLRYLRSLKLSVDVGEGDMSLLRSYLERGMPVIVAVETQHLPYWILQADRRSQSVRHAIVVVGMDESNRVAGVIYVNDPAFDDAPQQVHPDWFQLAWLERDDQYAVIRTG